MDKKADQYWQLMLIMLAVVGLIVAIIIIAYTNSEVSSFTDWLKWVS